MRLDDRARFGIDFARDMLFVELVAELDEALFVDALHEFRGARHQPGKADGAEAVLRDDLRLVVMSATIDGTRFASLLGDAPVVESEFEKLVDKYIANLIKKFGGEV